MSMTSEQFTAFVESRRSTVESRITDYYDCSARGGGVIPDSARRTPMFCEKPIEIQEVAPAPVPTVKVKRVLPALPAVSFSRVTTSQVETRIIDFADRLFAAIDAKDKAMAAELSTDMNLAFQDAPPCWAVDSQKLPAFSYQPDGVELEIELEPA